MKKLTPGQLLDLLKKSQAGRTNKEFAAELGISAQYLSDIYLGRRDPGPAVLAAFGLAKEIVYAPSEAKAAD